MSSRRICLPVVCVEYDEGGDTIWVQGLAGTVLRIKVDKVTSEQAIPEALGSFGECMATGEVKIYLAKDAELQVDVDRTVREQVEELRGK